MMVTRNRCCAIVTGLFITGAVSAQHLDTYEAGYVASPEGTIITGQQGFYIPVPDSQDGKVYTYAGNVLGLPANPTGGENFVGSTGGEVALPVPFARSQRDVPYPAAAFKTTYDVCVTKIGDALTSNNVGSFSTQLVAGGTTFGHIDLFIWTDPATSTNWDASMVWFDEGGVQVNEAIPEFVGFETNRWYRRSTTVGGDTNRIVELSITDLTTMVTITVYPVDRYAAGGPGSYTEPEGFRYFAGCSLGDCTEGNTLAWDNLMITPVPAVGSCCVPDTGDCLVDVSESECDAQNGVFNGIGTECGFPDCFQFGEDGWVVGAPIIWIGDTCGNDSICDLSDSPEERFEVTIPWPQIWTFSVCGQADFDTWMFLGNEGCTAFIDNDDCGSVESEIVTQLEAGTYFLTLEGFDGTQCGEFQLDIFADCPLVPKNPECIPESGEVCADEDTDPANVGCNQAEGLAPTFDTVNCGESRCGTVGNFMFEGGARRDLDWYRFEVEEAQTLTMSAIGSYPEVVILLAQLIATDLDGSGLVDFGDILRILASWGQLGGIEDLDMSGVVDFGDILQILASWGESTCPDPTPILASDSTDGCAETAEFTIEVQPGVYSLIITTDFDTTVLCGAESSYEFSLSCSVD